MKLPRIEGITIVEQIGRGGQASVFRAKRHGDGRDVAVKLFDQSLPTQNGRSGGTGEQAARRRFEREVLSLGRVGEHPAIVRMLDSGKTSEGRGFLVLEHADAGPLTDRIASLQTTEPLNRIDQATRLGVQLAGALEFGHRAGVIHCDVKPENILGFHSSDQFHSTEEAIDWRLSDFGIAVIDTEATENLQMSLAHAAPELFFGEPATYATDVYSLASVVRHVLTGHPAFDARAGETAPAFMDRVATDHPTDCRQAGVPASIALIIDRGMAKIPADRHLNARAFGLALNQARTELGLPKISMHLDSGDPDDPAITRFVDPSVRHCNEDLVHFAETQRSAHRGRRTRSVPGSRRTSKPMRRLPARIAALSLVIIGVFAGESFASEVRLDEALAPLGRLPTFTDNRDDNGRRGTQADGDDDGQNAGGDRGTNDGQRDGPRDGKGGRGR